MTKEQIQEKIVKLEIELQALKSELTKPIKFKLELYEGYRICSDGVTEEKVEQTTHTYLLRRNLLNAKADYQLKYETLNIGAIAEQLDPDYKSKLDWDDYMQPKDCICLYTPTNTYYVNSHYVYRALGVVYMPKDLAVKVCEILNNKELE